MIKSAPRNCGGCRYWSEMVARAGGGTDNANGDVEALCLGAASPHYAKYTTTSTTCDAWKERSDFIGAIDGPRQDARDLYTDLDKELRR